MSTEAIALREAQAVSAREKRTPDELIAEGRAQATALMKVVEQAGLSRDLGGSKKHLDVEAWQTIGRFNGYLTDIVWVRPIIEGGEKVGYEARAELVRIEDAVHIIGAESSCFLDEVFEKRDGSTVPRWDNEHAVRSMAQTRAQSKLGRMAFAWVAVLAGYSGTPAEEMDGVRNKSGGGRPIVFPFGKHKDQQPSTLSLDELHKELAFWQKKTSEEPNPKFAANNQRLIVAIQEAIAEKHAEPLAPKPAEPVAPYRYEPQPGDAVVEGTIPLPNMPHVAGEPSDLDKAWATAHELMEKSGWTEAKLTVWCRKNKGIGPKELDLMGVQALIGHLRTQ